MDISFLLVIVIAIIVAVALKRDGLLRSSSDSVFGGVCGGIAERYNISSFGARVLWVLCSLALGCGLITYIVLCCVVPRRK